MDVTHLLLCQCEKCFYDAIIRFCVTVGVMEMQLQTRTFSRLLAWINFYVHVYISTAYLTLAVCVCCFQLTHCHSAPLRSRGLITIKLLSDLFILSNYSVINIHMKYTQCVVNFPKEKTFKAKHRKSATHLPLIGWATSSNAPLPPSPITTTWTFGKKQVFPLPSFHLRAAFVLRRQLHLA